MTEAPTVGDKLAGLSPEARARVRAAWDRVEAETGRAGYFDAYDAAIDQERHERADLAYMQREERFQAYREARFRAWAKSWETLSPDEVESRLEAMEKNKWREARAEMIAEEAAAIRRAERGPQPLNLRPGWDYHQESVESTTDPVESRPEIAQYVQREADYLSVCAAQTGRFIPDSAAQKVRERRAEMDRNTVSLAQSLECRGERFFFGEDWANRCTVIGLYSGAVLPLPPVRRAAIFPSIAAQQRARMLRDIEHFCACRPPDTSKLFTITSGPRVHQVTLREETCRFHRALSKWNASPVFKRYGLRMQWRATEFGSLQWEAETGQATWHLHAHCLVTVERPMSHRRRRHVRRALWRLFRVNWDDAGTIENVREFVKYPAPPEQLDRLCNEGGPGAVLEFYEQVKGLHICQPLSDLRRIRAERKANGRRLVRLTVESEGSIIAEKADWNAGPRPLKDPSDRKRIKERAAQLAQSLAGVPALDQTEAQSAADSEGNSAQSRETGGKGPRIKNRIIARLAPAPYGGPILEPAVVVWGFTGDVEAVRSQRIAADIIAAHRAAWADAAAARALVLACATCARPRAAVEGSQRSNNCPAADPWWERELALAAADEGPPGQN